MFKDNIVEKGTFKVIKGKGILQSDTLGACVAVAALDKKARVGGLWIFVLPAKKILASIDNNSIPSFFCEEGLEEFLDLLKDKGAEIKDLKMVLVGGAKFLEAPSFLDLGGINASMIKKLLKEKGFDYIEHLGGPFPRSVTIDLSKNNILVKSLEKEEEV